MKAGFPNIQASGRVANTALWVFNVLCERPTLKLNEARRRAGVSFPSVANVMEALAKLIIAREITGQKRNRIFACDRYLSIITEGTEPL